MAKPFSPEHDPAPSCDAVRVTVHAMGRTNPVSGAWTPSPLEEITIADHLVRPGLLVVKMDNASMEPVIRRGAYVGIDSHDCGLDSGRIHALDIVEEGLTLRRVLRDPGDGQLLLQPENPVHPAQRCAFDGPGLTSLGTVVWVIQEI